MIKVEIDEDTGFCFGVVTAIHKAEEELAKGEMPVSYTHLTLPTIATV